jgi:hypothetical protein
VYLFGAVCPASGDAVGYLMPTVNTFCMNLHLAEISRSVAGDVHGRWCSTAPAGT